MGRTFPTTPTCREWVKGVLLAWIPLYSLTAATNDLQSQHGISHILQFSVEINNTVPECEHHSTCKRLDTLYTLRIYKSKM